jgi:hypothetical protein
MRTKNLVSILSLSILAAFLVVGAACGGDDAAPADARIIPTIDARIFPDAPPMIDAAPLPSIPATNLGKPCTMAMPCPNAAGGEICALIETGATTGICTIPCPTVSEEGPCGAGNGFPGPGVGYCAFTSGADPNMHFCGIGCGEQNGGNVMCPTGDTCKDLINMNGMGDLCAP